MLFVLLASYDFGQSQRTTQYLRETLSSCQSQPNVFHFQSVGETEHNDALEELTSRLLLVASEYDKVFIESEQSGELVNLTWERFQELRKEAYLISKRL